MRKRSFIDVLETLALDDVSYELAIDKYDDDAIIKFNRLRRKNVGNFVS